MSERLPIQMSSDDRRPDRDGADHIDDQEGAAAILAGHIGEPPDIAEPDSRPDRRKDESGLRVPLLPARAHLAALATKSDRTPIRHTHIRFSQEGEFTDAYDDPNKWANLLEYTGLTK